MKDPFPIRILHDPFSAIKFFSLLNLFSLVSAQTAIKKICQTKECLSAAKNLKESINFEADPCNDFYHYACGNWPNVHKSPNSVQGDTFQLRTDENLAELYDFLRQNNSEEEPEAVHKTRQFYALCVNNDSYKLEPVESILQKIGLPVLPSLSDDIVNYDYTTALAKVAKLAGLKMYFDLTTAFNPYNRTFNMITLKRIQYRSELDSTVMPLKSKSGRSKRATESNSIEQFIDEVVRTLCKDNTLASCAEWNNIGNTTRDTMVKKMLQQSSGIAKVNTKPATAFDTSLTPIIPVIYTLKQLQNLTDSIAIEVNATIPKLNWTRYLEETYADLDNVTLDLNDPSKIQISVESLDFVKEIATFLYKTEKMKILELQLWWKVAFQLLPYADFNIFEAKNKLGNYGDIPTRAQRCAEITKLSFGMAAGYAYTTKEKYIKAETEVREMVDHIRDSFKQIIQQKTWMDETTKQRALKKLQLLKSYIVYPSGIKNASQLNEFYRDVKISNSFCDTMLTKIQSQIKDVLSKLNQINDINEDDWSFSPSMVEAYYKLESNTIFIPAGILGLSLYNRSLRALDYGGIGSIIGHELTHAFDNIGRHYNEIGNIEDWWQAETLNSFQKKAECFVKAYGNYSVTVESVTQKGDSKLTLAEDISDNGGFKESLFGYRKFISESGEEPALPQFENFTHEQLLTIAFANVWCESPTADSSFTAEFREHSPHGVRVNGVLKNSQEFVDIWKCPRGSKMNPNVDKCSIW